MLSRWWKGTPATAAAPATKPMAVSPTSPYRRETVVAGASSRALEVVDKKSAQTGSPAPSSPPAAEGFGGSLISTFFAPPRRRNSGLTERHERLCPRRITFQTVWETIDRVGRAKVSVLPYVSLDEQIVTSDVARLVGADAIVVPACETCDVLVDFPLRKPTVMRIAPSDTALGFRRSELCLTLAAVYRRIYDEERDRAATAEVITPNPPEEVRPHRRNETDGPYGVYEYLPSDLLLLAVVYEPGSHLLRLEVDT